jgi:lysine decarboxylase
LLHLQGDRVSPERLTQALQLLQSTSPNALLLASLDAARGQMADGGEALMTQVLNLSRQAREALAAIPDLKLLDASASSAGFTYLDPTRLTVDIAAWGITGFEVDEILRQNWQVTAELPSLRQLTFIISLGNKQEDIDALIKAFQQFPRPLDPHPLHAPIPKPPPSELCLSPRRAVLAGHQTLPVAQALGHINTSLVCPYPPGIPVLIPGEKITPEAIAYLETIAALGGVITGLGPGGLAEWDIIKTSSV